MKTSETTAALAKALSAMQGVLGAAAKSAENPHFRSRYADLAACWDALREPLSRHGLAVIQATDIVGDTVTITTRLAHESGEWVESVYPVWPVKTDPQGYGSAITYARRYCLAAITGLTQDDDDGEAAHGRVAAASDVAPPQQQPRRTRTEVIVSKFSALGVSRAQVESVFGDLDSDKLNVAAVRKALSDCEADKTKIAAVFAATTPNER